MRAIFRARPDACAELGFTLTRDSVAPAFFPCESVRMIRHGFALVVVFVGLLSGCGGKVASDSGSTGGPGGAPGTGSSDPNKPTDGSCPPVGATYCSADDPVSADDIAQCNKGLSDPQCGSQYKDYLACAEQHITCDSTNRTDTNALQVVCNTQLTAYEQCIEGSPTPPSH
jgi:hypothetical protein